MDNLFNTLFKKLEKIFIEKFPRYIVKVYEMKSSFYVLIRKPRGKILNEDLVEMFDSVKNLSKKLYSEYSCISTTFRYRYFPYTKLIRCYGGYQYHFLIIRKDYQFLNDCFQW